MPTAEASIDAITSACDRAGIRLGDVERVAPDVVRGVPKGSRSVRLYVKTYPPHKRASIEAVLPHAEELRLPPSRLVTDGEVVAVVMEEAAGRPLSQVLPLGLLPGVWTVLHADLTAAICQLGRSLGTLHSLTRKQDGPLLDREEAERNVGRLDRFDLDLTEPATSRLEAALDRAPETEAVYACTHADPSPHNIFYTGGEITLIDVSLTEKTAAKDHANALMGLRLMAERVPIVSSSRRSVLDRAYWRGYNVTGLEETTKRARVNLLTVVKMLDLLEWYRDEEPATPLHRAVAVCDRSILQTEIRTMGRTLDPAAL